MPASVPGPDAEESSTIADGDGDERRPPTGALEALLYPDTEPAPDAGLVKVVDTPETRVRHPSDLVAIVLYALGVVLVLLAAVYAHDTTVGVAEDVQGFDAVLQRVLFVPVTVLSGLVTLAIPTAVLIELGTRKLGRQVVESIVAAALGLILGVLVSTGIQELGTPSLIRTFQVWSKDAHALVFTMPGYVTAIGGLLTAAGTRTRRRTVGWSWNLLLVTIGILLITGQVSLPGIIVSLLLGRIAGLAVRYVSGVRSERAYGPDLIAAIGRAGFRPTALVRVRDVTDSTALAEAAEDPITEVNAAGEITGSVQVGVPRDPDGNAATALTADADLSERHVGAPVTGHGAHEGTAPGPAAPSDPAAIALTRSGDNRVYAVFDEDRRLDAVVLDGDRQVVGFLTRLWRSIRLRGVEGRAVMSLRSVAERSALLSYAATAAGVRTPRLLGVGTGVDSMVLVTEHAEGAVSLRDLPEEDLTEDVLTECWRQLTLAHASGLAHRALTSDVVLVAPPPQETGAVRLVKPGDDGPRVWLTSWDQGDIASSTLARRMDVTQMIALLALRVGAERAVDSAARVLPADHIAAIGPLLQSVTLPNSTREDMRRNKALLKELREVLLNRLPEADVEPLKLNRFSARAIITIMLTVIAITVIILTFNFQEIVDAVQGANPWWVVASFVLGLLTWVGAALALVAFSPVRLSLWRTTLVQAAASFVGIAMPAGIGPAALNLRLLTRRGTTTPMAVATVALVQVSQFVVTIVLLLVLLISTSNSNLIKLPSATILAVVAILAVVVIVVLLIPSVRTWLIGRLRPMVEQVWPRLSQMLSQPGRLALGIVGNLVVTLGYVLAFNAALLAFGQELSLASLSIIYLASNAFGSATPIPGGVGVVEGALATGLSTLGGVPRILSFPIAVVFRLTTYWVRIPIGWVAMRYLQRVKEL